MAKGFFFLLIFSFFPINAKASSGSGFLEKGFLRKTVTYTDPQSVPVKLKLIWLINEECPEGAWFYFTGNEGLHRYEKLLAATSVAPLPSTREDGLVNAFEAYKGSLNAKLVDSSIKSITLKTSAQINPGESSTPWRGKFHQLHLKTSQPNGAILNLKKIPTLLKVTGIKSQGPNYTLFSVEGGENISEILVYGTDMSHLKRVVSDLDFYASPLDVIDP